MYITPFQKSSYFLKYCFPNILQDKNHLGLLENHKLLEPCETCYLEFSGARMDNLCDTDPWDSDSL